MQNYLGAKVFGAANIADDVGKIKVSKNVKVAGKLKNSGFINKIKNMNLPVGFKYKEAYGVQYAGISGSNME
ncbi:hypothetical protein [Clostridium massiliamazoniense]|uniref:hypothetical protein n=1 Tax=Clostridium massiliamazoniense TaxID=1347366 RepID=UPI0006D79853|nr:hypothetical protein [Clostridium massiliamazoniense]